MEIRKVQKTGDMLYLYLPTSWCRSSKITGNSKVSLNIAKDGGLHVSPKIGEPKPIHLKLKLNDDDKHIINKLVIACYVNPLDSFEIDLEKEIDSTKLLEQKKLIGLELVEIEKNKISCHSPYSPPGSESLLKIMMQKVKNILLIMQKNYSKELIDRYEEEVDKAKIFINKSVISAMLARSSSKLNIVDLHYIDLVAKDLERLVDHLITIEGKDKDFLEEIMGVIDLLDMLLSDPAKSKNRDYTKVIALIKAVNKLPDMPPKDLETYHKKRIKHYLTSISEVLMDWSITSQIEEAV
ncbi:phosphate uptake regulator PhoU [Candidatus Woesearchaeota archaeon]|nr:phosphate uptake regulator PhoU [Candidatus Woesearchaeota archaeon]